MLSSGILGIADGARSPLFSAGAVSVAGHFSRLSAGGTDFVSRSSLVQDSPIAPATLFDSPIGSTVLLDRVQRRMLCDGLAARLIGRTSLTRCRFRGSCRCDGDRDREQDASDAAIAYLHRRVRGAGYPTRR